MTLALKCSFTEHRWPRPCSLLEAMVPTLLEAECLHPRQQWRFRAHFHPEAFYYERKLRH